MSMRHRQVESKVRAVSPHPWQVWHWNLHSPGAIQDKA
jgi:hypothetical protein